MNITLTGLSMAPVRVATTEMALASQSRSARTWAGLKEAPALLALESVAFVSLYLFYKH